MRYQVPLPRKLIVRILYLTWVELSGLEPLTSCMPCKRSTN
jgi:hypothetical protein